LQPKDVRYLPQLDGLRALAILMVFAHHAFRIPGLWSGVDLFFILSGYLITGILTRDREQMGFRAMIGHFYLRRAQRILPAYVVFLVLAYPFVKADWPHVWGYYVGFLQNVPYAFGLVSYGPLVSLWSLAVEQHFYLFWPVLVYFLPRRWLAPCMIVLLVGTPILRALCTPLFSHPEAIYSLTPFRLDALAAGALAALILPQVRPLVVIRRAQVVMVLAAMTYVVLGVHPWFSRPANTAVFNALAYSLNILALGGLFVWVALSGDTFIVRIFAHPLLRALGRISYMFYLLHLGVLIQMSHYFGPARAAVAAFGLTTGLATLSRVMIEKPILSLSASYRMPAQPSAEKLVKTTLVNEGFRECPARRGDGG
jgi:peptidoglycan/LPS O-acetylase OafA/YrhL